MVFTWTAFGRTEGVFACCPNLGRSTQLWTGHEGRTRTWMHTAGYMKKLNAHDSHREDGHEPPSAGDGPVCTHMTCLQ